MAADDVDVIKDIEEIRLTSQLDLSENNSKDFTGNALAGDTSDSYDLSYGDETIFMLDDGLPQTVEMNPTDFAPGRVFTPLSGH